MDNNRDKNKGLFTLMFPILLLVIGVVGYFVYKGISVDKVGANNSTVNAYLANTRLGKNVDIIDKENLSFTGSMDNQSLKKQDFSPYEVVIPSKEVGRANPFLP